jgi:hypothetical protein
MYHRGRIQAARAVFAAALLVLYAEDVSPELSIHAQHLTRHFSIRAKTFTPAVATVANTLPSKHPPIICNISPVLEACRPMVVRINHMMVRACTVPAIKALANIAWACGGRSSSRTSIRAGGCLLEGIHCSGIMKTWQDGHEDKLLRLRGGKKQVQMFLAI